MDGADGRVEGNNWETWNGFEGRSFILFSSLLFIPLFSISLLIIHLSEGKESSSFSFIIIVYSLLGISGFISCFYRYLGNSRGSFFSLFFHSFSSPLAYHFFCHIYGLSLRFFLLFEAFFPF